MDGDTVYLIPAKEEDAAAMKKLLRPETLTNMSLSEKPITLESQTAYLREMAESRTSFLFCIMLNGVMIGTTGLHECDFVNKTARVGTIIFDPALRGRGYGKSARRLIIDRAFGEMSLNKVYINLLADNYRRFADLEKFGFRRECLLEKEYLLRGKYRNMIRFRLFKGEWKNICKKK